MHCSVEMIPVQISKRTMRRIMVKIVEQAYIKTNFLMMESVYVVLVKEIALEPEIAEAMAKSVYPINRITLSEIAEISRKDKTTEMSVRQLSWLLKRIVCTTRIVQIMPGAYEYSGLLKTDNPTVI